MGSEDPPRKCLFLEEAEWAEENLVVVVTKWFSEKESTETVIEIRKGVVSYIGTKYIILVTL